MKQFFNWVKSKVLDSKIYIARVTSWIGILNSLMLIFLVIEKLSSLGVLKGDLGNSLIFVGVAWFSTLIFLGWVEVNKMKMPHTESIKMLELNPPMKNAYLKIEEINKRTLETSKLNKLHIKNLFTTTKNKKTGQILWHINVKKLKEVGITPEDLLEMEFPISKFKRW